ncbi:MAG TPA: TonB family protein [Candidatus Krumholzibacteria bacterium]|nr:TonB family protein [Candidatus Krumholzibacteria bacterium]
MAIIKQFSLANAGQLPVTGDLHPLRREFTRWISWSNIFCLVVGGALFASWYVYSHRHKEDVVPRNVQIVKFTELGVPPSIQKEAAPQVNVAENIAPPTIGVPEPVPDAEATESTIASQAEMSDALAPITASDLSGGGNDSLVVDTSDKTPKPGEFVPFDELPVLLSVQPPVYPEMVREAGIDGTVTVQVLVGKDGKVKQAQAVDGPEPLRVAAVTAARTALFKPALQGTSPVEVWVMVPITFQIAK